MTGPAVSFAVEATDGLARAGILTTPHGSVPTPAFMPVGTRGTVRGLDPDDLVDAGAAILLANTYHLMLRPGSDVVAGLGGLHRFMGWEGSILTDSGGYQVLSLDPHVDEDGVTFRSVYDGSTVRLTPEGAVEVQARLGADIAMVLDQPVTLPADRAEVSAAMERTLRWSQRGLAVADRADQALFGIVQGGVDAELRAASARRTADLGFVGFGIGGLSVGETRDDRSRALEAVVSVLPAGAPRYVMGLGDTDGVLDAVVRGCDLFDCVWPTRLARHGKVLSRRGDFSIRRAELAAVDQPIDDRCPCRTCRHHSMGYLRHLHGVGELLAARLLSIHNLTYTLSLLAGARAAITEGRLAAFRSDVVAARTDGHPGPLR
jgi:queuine tRNA-ribosyltransferase